MQNHSGEGYVRIHIERLISNKQYLLLEKKLNHVAIIVSNVGRSLYFYTNIIGMQQIKRPDFDRHVSALNQFGFYAL